MIVHGRGLDSSAAAASLRRISPPIAARITQRLIVCCDLSTDTATRLLEAWASIDADPSQVYEWGLGNNDADVRLQSVWLVGQRRDRDYLELLEPMLTGSEDPAVRGMAAWSVVRTLGPEINPTAP